MSRRRTGFTLLELIVAVAILATALVGVMRVVTQGINSTKEGQDRQQGMELAEQKLAELMLSPDNIQPGQNDGDFGDLYPRFRWQSEITTTDLDSLYRVKVTVTWLSGTNEHSVDVETCYAPNVLVDPTAGASPSSSSSSPSPSSPSS